MESLLVDGRTICLPFLNNDHYEQCMKEPDTFRQLLADMHSKHPELFPRAMARGYTLHSFTRPSRKQEGFRMRRIELADGNVYQIRPSFTMPYLIARTDEVKKALFLCRWGVPF